ncbi:PAS domain S-box protein [Vibrio diazotrophicus]|uniref:PAS domain S-box protein n=1 Tax=Vibrio diazotrophicus TaxID=685 RepID=UPI003D2F5899
MPQACACYVELLIMFDHFFVVDVSPDKLVAGTYNVWLVAVSIFLASMASFFALRLASTARHIQLVSHRRIALLSGSFVMAGGIWSMHFVGMLAFAMPHQMEYDHHITALSFVPAVLASYFVLKSLINETYSLKITLRNGFIVGAGIGAMHYIGMEAMNMDLDLRYDPYWFALSIVVSVGLATIALTARSRLRHAFPSLRSVHANLISAAIMGSAISGMHYTGMEAARFIEEMECVTPAFTEQDNTQLAIIVSIFTLLLSTLAVNVSSQLRYRQLLREKTAGEARLQAILDTAADGVITIDAKGIVRGINGAACKIFGWLEHEVIGRNVSMLMPSNHQYQHDSYLENYFSTGKAQIIGSPRELYARHRFGELIPVRLAVGRVSLESGETLFVGFVSDISERKAMEEKLRESEQRLSSLMQNIPGASFRRLLDHKWTPVFLSEGIVELTGYNADEFLSGRVAFVDCVYEGKDRDLCSNMRANIDERDTYEIEYRIHHKNGNTVWVLENGMVVRDENNNVVWADGVMVDISSRKQMEQELVEAKQRAEHAAESKAAFLANMSHEIRTPMNAIIGFTDILLDSDIRGEDRKHLQTISHSSRSLLHLLNDILDSAKLEKNKMEIEQVPFKLAACVDTVISTLWLSAKNKGIELNLAMADDLPQVVLGAEDRIRQVLMNLVGNGIKFTESGGVSLTVSAVEQKPDWIRFSVIDSGIGIDPSRLKSIFEPFTQADASMSRRFGGTGLGTTISQQLVELMGGTIQATSELGKGSCFTIELPLPKSEAATVSRTSHIFDLPSLRVLVCDDIEQNINLLRILLERQNHKVFTAQDGHEAVAQFKSVQPDIILMDIQMPNLDGLGASKQIRQWEKQYKLASTPIIALTASVLAEDRVEARESGMDGFENKPVDFSLLTQEMARVLHLEPGSQDEQNSGSATDSTVGKFNVVNLNKALKLWGDERLYLGELIRLSSKQAALSESLMELIDAQNWSELGQQAHRLKGLTGNLALIPLLHAFSDLERAVNAHMPTQARSAVTNIEKLWNTLMSDIEQLQVLYALDEEVEPESSLRNTELQELLEDWLIATRAGELRDETVAKLKQGSPEMIKKHINDAVNAIEEFEFEAAERAIINAIETLQQKG